MNLAIIFALFIQGKISSPAPTSSSTLFYFGSEVIKIPNPHFDIKVTQRSKRQSAVAGAAYQSGEKLFSEYDQKTKNYSGKRRIVYTEIMLPSNAPPEFSDRAKLWNSVEAIEKQWNSQLARRLVLALPNEVPQKMYPQMIHDYCQEHFVSKGMIADFAIHDIGGNPHAHIMLTVRAIDENGQWLPKSRKVYDLDEKGNRIRLPSGEWKSHKENTVDWNDQKYGEIWRHGWEIVQNRYLEMVGSPERVDLRSYKKQGINIAPTVHMGPAVTQMERKGIQTNIGNLNRDIQSVNRMIASVRSTIKTLKELLSEIIKIISVKNEEQSSPYLHDLLGEYFDIRKAERLSWSRYGQEQGSVKDLKMMTQTFNYLQERKLFTLKDLDDALESADKKAASIISEIRKAERRMKVISGIKNAVSTCKKYKSTHNKYIKIGWKITRSIYFEKHKEELELYNKAYRYLKKHGVDLEANLESLQDEYDSLQKSHKEYSQQLSVVREELKLLKQIRHWVERALTSDKTEIIQKSEARHSVIEQFSYYSRQSNQSKYKPKEEKDKEI